MSLIFFLILLFGLYMQIKLLLRKHPQHISPMHTVQTNNQIACPQTGKSWLTYRDECPAEGGAAHNSRHRLQNKRAWNLRAQCELKWKESEEKGSHTWWNLVRWQSPSHSLLLLSRSLSGDGAHLCWTFGHSYLKPAALVGLGVFFLRFCAHREFV